MKVQPSSATTPPLKREIVTLSDDEDITVVSPPPPKRRKLTPPSSSPANSVPASFTSAHIGTLIVQAYATTSGTGYASPGELLSFERPKQTTAAAKKARQASIKDMMGGGKAKAKEKENTIVRFRNVRGFEVGRLPSDLTKSLTPLLDASPPMISLSGTVIDAPTRLSVGAEIVLSLRVSLTPAAFKRRPLPTESSEERKTFGWGEGKETDEEREMKARKAGIGELFKLCELRPKVKPAVGAWKEEGDVQEKKAGKKERKTEMVEETGEEVELEGEELNDGQLKVIYKKAQSADRKLPFMEPAESFALELRPYQKQALHWMYTLETTSSYATNSGSLHPLWEEYEFPLEEGKMFHGKAIPFWYNPYSGELSLEFVPAGGAGRGGILAVRTFDTYHLCLLTSSAVGMGKSIMIASLIHTNRGAEPLLDNAQTNGKPKKKQLTLDSSFRAVPRKPTKSKTHGPSATLIVAPMSLLTQWQSELKRSSAKNTLKVLVFHGDSRGDLEALTAIDSDEDGTAGVDVVITSYGTLVSEWSKTGNGGGIYDVDWKRIVLDEAHNIKSRLTKAAKACYALKSRTKWCLTGTPIINRLEDLQSLLQFLDFQPWANFSVFRSFVTAPFLARDPKAIDVVQVILETVLLRREKNMTDVDGKAIVDLPEKEVVVEELEFSPLERKIYDQIYHDAQTQFRRLDAKGLVGKNFSNILAMLMRLRQAVLHPALIGGRKQELDIEADLDVNNLIAQFTKGNQEGDESTTNGDAFAKNVLDDLIAAQNDEDGSSEECPICLEIMDPPMIVPNCMHRTCRDCVVGHLRSCESKGEEGFCPICRKAPVREADLLEVIHKHSRITDRDSTPDAQTGNVNPTEPPSPAIKFRKNSSNTSTKLNALSTNLRRLRDQDPTFRAVVFSQFTGFLDMIETVLDRDDIPWVRLDGSMSQKERTRALEEFAKPTRSPKVFLISLKAGGVGLNLTTANHVFMMDCWWNASVENQAIDRVHRIGQTRKVYVKQFIIARTIEMRILNIQKRKTAIIKGALGDKSQSEALDNLSLMFGDD
ncbi:hypothetical protein CALCODRAFT_426276 [Calocera cornea HHB12733]|uniref:DNA repair protein RAD5 n=1 Tax=Calocera cornea HHB12733 TaxID=1353952 RepID=A0A165JV40_9BASI|nr:hypothetical protein CALCODRAFT_426276 [Calocera cornea HHB12733]